MKIRVAVVDDDKMSRDAIYQIADTFLSGKRVVYEILLYESSMELLLDLEQGSYFEIYLLDVEMPVLTGIELARKIRKYYYEPAIIYITDYVKYSIEAFEVDAFRYIPKRYIEEKLPEALELLFPRIKTGEDSNYIIRYYLDMEVIHYKDIFYLQKEGKYVIIYHSGGKSRDRKSLKEVLSRLPEDYFVEVGRGYVINITHLMSVEKREIRLRNGMTVPLSRSGIAALQERIGKIWNVSL